MRGADGEGVCGGAGGIGWEKKEKLRIRRLDSKSVPNDSKQNDTDTDHEISCFHQVNLACCFETHSQYHDTDICRDNFY